MTDLLDALKDAPRRSDRKVEFLMALEDISNAHKMGYSFIAIYEALTSQDRFHGSYGQFCYLARRFIPKDSWQKISPTVQTSPGQTPPKAPESEQGTAIGEELRNHSSAKQTKSVFHWPPRPVKDLL